MNNKLSESLITHISKFQTNIDIIWKIKDVDNSLTLDEDDAFEFI